MPDSYFEDQDDHGMVTSLSSISDERFIITKLEGASSPTLKYFFSTKVSINCDMNFDNFPFDSQICKFRIRSLKNDPNLLWTDLEATNSSVLRHSEFWVVMETSNDTALNGVNFIGFNLIIGRKFGSYVYEYFLPCFLMVITSWISFTVKVLCRC